MELQSWNLCHVTLRKSQQLILNELHHDVRFWNSKCEGSNNSGMGAIDLAPFQYCELHVNFYATIHFVFWSYMTPTIIVNWHDLCKIPLANFWLFCQQDFSPHNHVSLTHQLMKQQIDWEKW